MAFAMVSRVASGTNPLPAASELAGAPMNNFTFGLTEFESAQAAQIAKLKFVGYSSNPQWLL